MKKVQLIVFVFILGLVWVSSAQDSLNPRAQRPLITSSPQLSKEVWESVSTDYFSENATVSGASVNIETVLGSEASVGIATVIDSQECAGLTTQAPTYRFIWQRNDRGDNFPITLLAIGAGSQDLTLVIHEPDGDWLCMDDTDTSTNPMKQISSLRSGSYAVWVGNKSIEVGDDFRTRLYVSINDGINPDEPPAPCCDGLSFSNPASGSLETEITYHETAELGTHDQDNELLFISTDIIFRGEPRTTFLVEALASERETGVPIDFREGEIDEACPSSTGYCEVERLRLSDESRRDYSEDSSGGAVEFTLPVSVIKAQSEDYDISLVISEIDDETNEITVVSKLIIFCSNLDSCASAD